jgi:hypothetical protein
MDQAASYPGDLRHLAVAADVFEAAPELEPAVCGECARLGLGLLQVHGSSWVECLVTPCEHPPPGRDWLELFARGAELRAELLGHGGQ